MTNLAASTDIQRSAPRAAALGCQLQFINSSRSGRFWLEFISNRCSTEDLTPSTPPEATPYFMPPSASQLPKSHGHLRIRVAEDLLNFMPTIDKKTREAVTPIMDA
ncbi:hypothetical protein [Ottowia thiooxydans]|uniref:hypothetical protein n=1 Tax=Ottowia thiooxydans TaxID=219182 RepID=UPI0004902763|nr:hypothetical protein [Ottowia thiooxydans]